MLIENKPMVWQDDDYELGAMNQYENDLATIKAVPSAQPKRGKWIDDGQHSALFPFHDWRCSKCNEIVIEIDVPWFKFCPNCGADMRE